MNSHRRWRRVLMAAALLLSAGACSKRPSQPAASSELPLFREAALETGLNFHHFTGATGEYYLPEIMGSGVALIDYDNDGDLDVYLIQGTFLDPSKKMADALFPSPAGWKPGNRLFRNLLAETGKLQFVDVTEQAGVGHVGYGMGVAVGDYDNDGYPDIYVTNFGHNVLYHNNRNGTFTDVTQSAGVDDARWSSSAAWVDYDHDGLLDLFVANYVDFTVKGNKRCYSAMGELDYCTPSVYQPVPARLFHNLGNGKFEDVTAYAGVGKPSSGLGVVCADFNGDGLVDIYVANDARANHLWLNQGNGTFKEVALSAGVAYNGDGMAQAGMGATAGDFDNDGAEDILVTNLTREGSVLYHNDGKGNFGDVTAQFGLLQPTFPFTGFGAQWFDYDNDGWLDLFIANGAASRMESLRGSRYPFDQPRQLFHNEGPGKPFREMTRDAGKAFEPSEVGRGAAFGDIDNDGDIDIVVANNNGPARLLLNQSHARLRHHWLAVRLDSQDRNRFGLGARVTVFARGLPPLSRRAHTDGSYLSASDPRVHFGLGNAAAIERVVVLWPDGLREAWTGIPLDRLVTLRRGTGHPQ